MASSLALDIDPCFPRHNSRNLSLGMAAISLLTFIGGKYAGIDGNSSAGAAGAAAVLNTTPCRVSATKAVLRFTSRFDSRSARPFVQLVSCLESGIHDQAPICVIAGYFGICVTAQAWICRDASVISNLAAKTSYWIIQICGVL